MKSQRIAVFYQHMPPFPSAIALRGESICKALFNNSDPDRVKICVIAASGEPPSQKEIDFYLLDGNVVENSAGIKKRLFGEIRLGWSIGLKLMKIKPAGAYLSSPPFLANLTASWFCRALRIPYVLEVRDIYPQVYFHAELLKKSSVIYKILKCLSCTMYRKAELLIAVTKGLFEEIESIAGDTSVELVYNGYPESLKQIRPAKKERFTLCFHGVLGFFQDIETLVELTKELEKQSIDVVVIGYGRKEGLLDIELPNLQFLGHLSFEETIQNVSRCHLGLCLRKADGISKGAFPIKVWEYLGLGIPTIITPHCEAGEFLKGNGCGQQLEAGDKEELLKSILEYRDNKEKYQLASRNCEKAAAEFTRENLSNKAVKEVLEVFQWAGKGQ